MLRFCISFTLKSKSFNILGSIFFVKEHPILKKWYVDVGSVSVLIYGVVIPHGRPGFKSRLEPRSCSLPSPHLNSCLYYRVYQ